MLKILHWMIFFFLIFNIVNATNLEIIDGDTIKIDNIKIRFSGIDSPELSQTCLKDNLIKKCGITARLILINKIGKNKPICIHEGIDRYKRILAECYINNESLSKFLVRKGYAFAYRSYSNKFIEDENYARINKIGMWNMNFIYPWDFRKKK